MMTLEKNIERIADALEAVARMMGAKAPSGEGNTAVQQPVPQAQQPAMQQAWQGGCQGQVAGQLPPAQQPQGQVPVSLPAGTGTPWTGGKDAAQAGGAPVRQPGGQTQQPGSPGTVPTTASAQQYTFDQLAVATANLASSGKDVFSILGRFGVNMLMDLPREQYGGYAAALREAGAVI